MNQLSNNKIAHLLFLALGLVMCVSLAGCGGGRIDVSVDGTVATITLTRKPPPDYEDPLYGIIEDYRRLAKVVHKEVSRRQEITSVEVYQNVDRSGRKDKYGRQIEPVIKNYHVVSLSDMAYIRKFASAKSYAMAATSFWYNRPQWRDGE